MARIKREAKSSRDAPYAVPERRTDVKAAQVDRQVLDRPDTSLCVPGSDRSPRG